MTQVKGTKTRRIRDAYAVINSVAGVKLVNDLLRSGFEIYWASQDFQVADFSFEAGTFIACVRPNLVMKQCVRRHPIDVYQLPATLELKGCLVGMPRIALYNGQGVDGVNARFRADAEYAMDLLGFSYFLVNECDIQKGILGDFDVLVVTSGDATEMLNGWNLKVGWNKYPWQLPGSPKGLKEKGLMAIKAFIERGGGYIGIGSGGGALACKEVGGLANVSMINIPYEQEGPILAAGKARVYLRVRDANSPVMFGIRSYTNERGTISKDLFPAYYFSDPMILTYGGPIFKPGENVEVLATYHSIDSESWTGLIPSTKPFTEDHPAIVQQRLGKGRMVLFGVDILHGASWISTFKLLANSIYYITSKESFNLVISKS